MNLHDRYPSVDALRRRARRRIPHFAWEYLDSGTGNDTARDANTEALGRIEMWPNIAAGKVDPQIETTLFGTTYAAPFGIAPVGLTGLMWPGAELHLGRAAASGRVPFCLSTFASQTPEVIYRIMDGMGWFQLYPPVDKDVRQDLIDRAKGNGYSALVVTVDVPIGSRRERQREAGVSMPPRKGLRTLYRSAIRPAWLRETIRHGQPKFRTLWPYAGDDIGNFMQFVAREFSEHLTWDTLAEIRDQWDGTLILKGVMRSADARKACDIGYDGIWVSNHGGRQFDAAPAAIDVLPAIRTAVGDDAKVIFDSGLRSGLDIARALAFGADFCMFGRAFIYAVAALGQAGPGHLIEILEDDLKINMIQMGASRLADLPDRLVVPSA